MHSEATTGLTWSPGTDRKVPPDLTGVRWPDGTIECRFRLLDRSGSLVASDGEVGIVLTADHVECTTCSDACAT
jgi:hypothetical protein